MEEITKSARPRGTDAAKVIQVVVTESLMGTGAKSDPCRMIIQYWSLDGKLLAYHDPVTSAAFEELHQQ